MMQHVPTKYFAVLLAIFTLSVLMQMPDFLLLLTII